jgi:hypothetical protein
MKRVLVCVLILTLASLAFVVRAQDQRIALPAGGNAWLSGGSDKLTNEGIVNWSDQGTVCSLFARVHAGVLDVAMAISTSSVSRFRVTIDGQAKEVVTLPGQPTVPAGTWTILKDGYQAITLQGINKEGKTFGDFSGLELGGSAVAGEVSLVPNNEGNYFYWGRRGPSVHLRYDLGGRTDMECFYSEITVPEGNDVIGSYYMANGFSDGYFGFQVNSETERRVLFSVWSPFKTDDPKSIPETDRIRLMKKGEGVYTGEFGNEGSGGQSYLRYPWKAGNTYGFLLRAQPEGTEATIYTAWFMAPEIGQWQLIASFRRPMKATYLTGLYSFLENFVPETGQTTRMARYGNQWVRDASGRWTELTQVKFTGDNTARKNYRKDYAGGVRGNAFYLRNCGFFSDYTKLDQVFDRPSMGAPPKLDLTTLP